MAFRFENTAVSYINFGRWVADCPAGCGNAFALQKGETLVHCTSCKNIAPVRWPSHADELWEVLLQRPLERTRNWFPKNHPLAVMSGSTHGETPEELRQETIEHTLEDITPFWSENYDNGNEPKKRDCADCVEDKPHKNHWAGVKAQDRGLGSL